MDTIRIISTTGTLLAEFEAADLRSADLQNADLRGANLQGAFLQNANLQGAFLQNADLQNADLRSADLRGANLQWADLRGADLQGAFLQNADLRGADLQNANLQAATLRNADLRGANLQNADLQWADLQNADLQWADLRGAALYCAALNGATLPPPMVKLPRGSFTAYKRVHTVHGEGVVLTLEVLADAQRVASLVGRKCRASAVLVLAADCGQDEELYSIYDPTFTYRVGAVAEVSDFDADIRVECTRGIHFFLTYEEAEAYI